MFKIGDFSKLCRVPVKTLRYYDQIGLLKPVGIDRFTRYRYYDAEQLPVLYRILALKELGFSLEQIASLLQGDLSAEQLKTMLQTRRAEIERTINSAQDQLARVEARLRQLEQQGKGLHYEVVLKELAPQWVAAICGQIEGFEQLTSTLARLFDQLNDSLASQGIIPSGPGMALYHEAETPEECTRVDVLLPLSQPHNLGAFQSNHQPAPEFTNDSVHEFALPGCTMAASVVYHGRLEDIGEAYRTLLAWIQANRYRISGAPREVYLRSVPEDPPEGHVIEIQYPIAKIKEAKMAKTHEIVKLEAFTAIGMRYLGRNENQEISTMWGEFIPRLGEIRHVAPGPEISYGICSESPEGLIDYVAGLPVTQAMVVPPGMVVRQVPAQTYVVVPAYGLDDIGPTYNYIQNEWLPNSGYRAGEGPDFELYPEEFDGSENSELYIYYPIIPR